MLPGKAVQTGLTCSAIEKKDHTVLRLVVLFGLVFFGLRCGFFFS